MIQLIFPDAPRPGWPGRTRYLVRQSVIVVLQAALLFAAITVVSVYVLALGLAS